MKLEKKCTKIKIRVSYKFSEFHFESLRVLVCRNQDRSKITNKTIAQQRGRISRPNPKCERGELANGHECSIYRRAKFLLLKVTAFEHNFLLFLEKERLEVMK